jgi:predicted signal transduction protein with EAL and GGDEF domain
MAERMGQIGRITQIVLRKALEVSEKLPRGVRLSVNLSAHDIGSAAAMDAVVAQVQAAPRPSRIEFEITETAVMRDLDQAKEALSRLLSLGARIALDDFGTGHSSLTHVQCLPLHRIKIDRSFVAVVTSDATSRAIVKTMVDLCRNLGISCVFEGIETEAQLEALVGLGGTVMQGYLFGRPTLPDLALEQAAKKSSNWHAEPAHRYGTTS